MAHALAHFDESGCCDCNCPDCTTRDTEDYDACICPQCDKRACGMHQEPDPESPDRAAVRAAAARVTSFLEAWNHGAPHSQRNDTIYGLGVNREDATRDLLASDLRTLLGAVT